ncbi:hypothetical protein GOODEAATRI_028026 [Goodea atripinnis]|uniref:Uncharacterized protein n=1 Tax=Goodea atripinnis TaxID=208336 RepID=A0ABV0NEA0_9TELE
MEEESRSHICRCSKVCQAAMREEPTADTAQRLRMVSAKLQNSSTSSRGSCISRTFLEMDISYLGYDVRQHAKKHTNHRKSDGCRHREALSLDWCNTCLRILHPEEGSGDTISRCLSIPAHHRRCPMPPRGRIVPLWGIPLLVGRKWLAAVDSPPAGRAGGLQGQGQVSVIGTEAALADDMQVVAHNVASKTSRAKADSSDASHHSCVAAVLLSCR